MRLRLSQPSWGLALGWAWQYTRYCSCVHKQKRRHFHAKTPSANLYMLMEWGKGKVTCTLKNRTRRWIYWKHSYFSGIMHSGIKILILGTQLSHLWNTSVTSLELNWCFFGTQLSHIWNTTVTLRKVQPQLIRIPLSIWIAYGVYILVRSCMDNLVRSAV